MGKTDRRIFRGGNMKRMTLDTLLKLEETRQKNIWTLRESCPVEDIHIFLRNMKLIDENMETFDEIFNRFK